MPGMFRGLHRAFHKHQNKAIVAFNVVGWGIVLALTVKTLSEDSAFPGEKPGATTVSPGPTIQGFDLPPVVERAKRTSAEKKVEEEKGGGPGEEA